MAKKRKRQNAKIPNVDSATAGLHLIRSKKRGKKVASNLAVIKNNFAEILRPSIDSLNARNDQNKVQLGIVAVANSNAEHHALLKQAIDNFGGILPNVNRISSQATLAIQANSILALTEELIKRAFGEKQCKPITREDARTAINQLSKAVCLLWASSSSLPLEHKMFQIYLYRAILYGKFSNRNFTAFRLNANATFSYLTGEYSRKCYREIRYVGAKLHKSYLDTIRYSWKSYIKSEKERNVKKSNFHKDKVVRKSKKALKALLSEAFITFDTNEDMVEQGTTNLSKITKHWFKQYRQIKSKVEKETTAFAWKFLDQTQPTIPTQQRKSADQSVKKSLFRKWLTYNFVGDHFCTRARQKIPKGRIILSEPIIVAKWFQAGKFCAECNKLISDNWVFPCSVCTLARFCSETCAKMSQMKSLHNGGPEGKCTKFGHCLGLYASMAHKIAEWLGNPVLLNNLTLTDAGGSSQFVSSGSRTVRMLNENYLKQGQNYKLAAVASPISSYFIELNDITLEETLMVDTFHLMNVFAKSFSNSSQDLLSMGSIFYQLLYFLKHFPFANAKIGPALPQRRRKRQNVTQQANTQKTTKQQVQPKSARQKKTGKKRKPILYGQAFGPLGAIFEFSCQPNIRRQLNVKTGQIEYCVTKEVQKGEKLLVGFTTFKVRNRNPHNWIEEHFLKKCVNCKSQVPHVPPAFFNQ